MVGNNSKSFNLILLPYKVETHSDGSIIAFTHVQKIIS